VSLRRSHVFTAKSARIASVPQRIFSSAMVLQVNAPRTTNPTIAMASRFNGTS